MIGTAAVESLRANNGRQKLDRLAVPPRNELRDRGSDSYPVGFLSSLLRRKILQKTFERQHHGIDNSKNLKLCWLANLTFSLVFSNFKDEMLHS